MQLAGEATKVVHGEKSLNPTQPIFGELKCDGKNWKEISPGFCKTGLKSHTKIFAYESYDMIILF